MARTRTALLLVVALVAGIAPQALGGPAAAAPAAEVGTVVQEGGRLTVPAGTEGPVTLRLKVTLPAGVTGPVRARLALPVTNYPRGLAEALRSTCAVDGGAFAPCAWDLPWIDGEEYPYPVRLTLPVAEAATTLAYAVTIDTSSDEAWLGSLDAPVELADSTGAVVARGAAGLDFVLGTSEPNRLGAVHARDRNGVLWRYEGTSRLDKPLKPRKKIGAGWNAYTAIVPVSGILADGTGDLVARDRAGVLWYYKGTGKADAPFAPRVKVGGGWNIYTAFAGRANGSLVARDRSGVLWVYERNHHGSAPLTPRSRVGAGWNVYHALTGYSGGPLARDADGVLWKYDETGSGGDPEGYPFRSRLRVGAGWNAYTAFAGTVDLGRRSYPDVVARDKSGHLWLYQGVIKSGALVPGPARTPVGPGWNIYDLIF
ncbi:tachylectin-related carbohydrate-binding protein [Streptomyces diastatochromogenes]|nr:tachylectin-related carbohydrate-binding protein [Streptomyces diastatochromogenes]